MTLTVILFLSILRWTYCAPPKPYAEILMHGGNAFPVVPIYMQYHAQGEDGSYFYGYRGGPSSKKEVRDNTDFVAGGYSYIDPNGELQIVEYKVDDGGFHVAATNLPKPVEETPEVKAAREEFERLFKIAEDSSNPQGTAEATTEFVEPVTQV